MVWHRYKYCISFYEEDIESVITPTTGNTWDYTSQLCLTLEEYYLNGGQWGKLS